MLVFAVSWLAVSFVCYSLLLTVRNAIVRSAVTVFVCVLNTWLNCADLPRSSFYSMVIIALSWLISVRLIDLTGLSSKRSTTFFTFFVQTFWIVFPLLPWTSVKHRSSFSLTAHLVLMLIKLLVNHWIYRWFLHCQLELTSWARLSMFYLILLSISYLIDAETLLVRLVTANRYTLESFTDFPPLSVSLRQFWGQRYNRLVSGIFRQSIFVPVSHACSSPTIAGLLTFTVSALLHVHLVAVLFDDRSTLLRTFLFFFLHGLASSLEARLPAALPRPLACITTHAFLLLTAPLFLEPFVSEHSLFFRSNPPPLLNASWIPALPVPHFCP